MLWYLWTYKLKWRVYKQKRRKQVQKIYVMKQEWSWGATYGKCVSSTNTYPHGVTACFTTQHAIKDISVLKLFFIVNNHQWKHQTPAKKKKHFYKIRDEIHDVHKLSFAFWFYKLLQRMKLWTGSGMKLNETWVNNAPNFASLTWQWHNEKTERKKDDFKAPNFFEILSSVPYQILS